MTWTRTPSLFRGLHWPGQLDAYRQLDRIQSEVNRLLAPLSRVFAEPQFPAVRVLTNEDGALLVAPLPGVDPSEIEVTCAAESSKNKLSPASSALGIATSVRPDASRARSRSPSTSTRRRSRRAS